jgi:hypothetical protein
MEDKIGYKNLFSEINLENVYFSFTLEPLVNFARYLLYEPYYHQLVMKDLKTDLKRLKTRKILISQGETLYFYPGKFLTKELIKKINKDVYLNIWFPEIRNDVKQKLNKEKKEIFNDITNRLPPVQLEKVSNYHLITQTPDFRDIIEYINNLHIMYGYCTGYDYFYSQISELENDTWQLNNLSLPDMYVNIQI